MHLLVLGLVLYWASPQNKLSRKSKFTENRVWNKKLWLFFRIVTLCCPRNLRRFCMLTRRLWDRKAPCLYAEVPKSVGHNSYFWPLMANFYGVSIYIYPHISWACCWFLFYSQPIPSLVRALSNTSLCESEWLVVNQVLESN